jgi:hypothetical protein
VKNYDFSVKGVYVVTAVEHFLMQGTLFRISNLEEEDTWLKLSFLEGDMKGYPFILLKKVLAL